MKASEELALLVAQERAIAPPPGAVDRGWTALHDSLACGTPPLAVAVTPLKLTSTWTVVKVGLLPFVLGAAIGTGAMGVTSVALQSSASSGSSTASTSPPTTPRADVPAPMTDPPARAAVNPAATGSTSALAPLGRTPAAASFDAELALIQSAKTSLDEGESDAARQWLEEHRREFPHGVFASEREGLLILLACRGGDPRAGRAAARKYLQGRSVLADHIERACGLIDDDSALDK